MTWTDWLILAILAASVISAYRNGFLVEVFSLVGLLFGVSIAAVEYSSFAPWLERWTQSFNAANLVAFLLIALGVMLLAGALGRMLRTAVRWVGLGFLDRLLGAALGLFKGVVVVGLALMAVAAFFPNSEWLKGSRMVKPFLSVAHNGSHLTPFDFGEKVRDGVQLLRGTGKAYWNR